MRNGQIKSREEGDNIMKDCPKCSSKNLEEGICQDCGFNTNEFNENFGGLGIVLGDVATHRISREEFHRQTNEQRGESDSEFLGNTLNQVSMLMSEHVSKMQMVQDTVGCPVNNVNESLAKLPSAFQILVDNSDEELLLALDASDVMLPTLITIAQAINPLLALDGEGLTEVSRASYLIGYLVGKGKLDMRTL